MQDRITVWLMCKLDRAELQCSQSIGSKKTMNDDNYYCYFSKLGQDKANFGVFSLFFYKDQLCKGFFSPEQQIILFSFHIIVVFKNCKMCDNFVLPFPSMTMVGGMLASPYPLQAGY